MSKLIRIVRIGICPIDSVSMQESGMNLRELVQEWFGLGRIGLEKNGLERN